MCISLFILLGQLLVQLRCLSVQPTLRTDSCVCGLNLRRDEKRTSRQSWLLVANNNNNNNNPVYGLQVS